MIITHRECFGTELNYWMEGWHGNNTDKRLLRRLPFYQPTSRIAPVAPSPPPPPRYTCDRLTGTRCDRMRPKSIRLLHLTGSQPTTASRTCSLEHSTAPRRRLLLLVPVKQWKVGFLAIVHLCSRLKSPTLVCARCQDSSPQSAILI